MSEEAGPSAPPQNGSRFVQDVLDRIDVEAFDWPAYEGTYKGASFHLNLDLKQCSLYGHSLTLSCSGRALITRLLHVPSLVLSSPLTTPSNRSLARAALLRLIPLVRSTLDVVTYTNVMDHLAHLSGKELAQGEDEAMDFPVPAEGSGREAEGVASSAWVQEAWESERRESARLDVELRGYMSNLIKESIRVSQTMRLEERI
jgi:COP9 signalosome complex subunit 1